jgi:hypothetical protein
MTAGAFGALFLWGGPPILLFVGTVMTIVLVTRSRGERKVLALVLAPALTLAIAVGVTMLVTKLCQPTEREGFLMGGAAIGLYFVGLRFIYYPALLVVGVVRLVRRPRTSTRLERLGVAIGGIYMVLEGVNAWRMGQGQAVFPWVLVASGALWLYVSVTAKRDA